MLNYNLKVFWPVEGYLLIFMDKVLDGELLDGKAFLNVTFPKQNFTRIAYIANPAD